MLGRVPRTRSSDAADASHAAGSSRGSEAASGLPGHHRGGIYGQPLLALATLTLLASVTPCRRAAAQACDIESVRAQVQASLPDYGVDAVRVDRGIVTLLFSARNGPGKLAVALHASGTKLATSLNPNQLDSAELARLSRTISTWWENAPLQQALAACGEGKSDEPPDDLGSGVRRAAESALGRLEGEAGDDLISTLRRAAEYAIPRRERSGHDTIPTSLALLLALCQVAVLAAVIFSGVRRTGADSPSARRVSWLALFAIGVCAFIVARRYGGPSAMVWSDTFNDQAEVESCLERSACTIYGVGTSVPGFVHAGGWLQLRDLLSVIGLSMDHQTLFLQILDALGVALTAMVAWQLAGPAAAAIATWAVWNRYGALGVSYDALYNSLPMAFLGAVYLVACVRAVEQPSTRSVGAAGLVGGILANVHFAGVCSGITPAVLGLFAPRRRIRLALVGGATFALGTFVISPATWVHAATYALGHPGGEHHEIASVPLTAEPLVIDGLWLTAIWIVALLLGRRFAGLRRQLDAVIAIIAPPLAIFVLAGLTERINPTGKYIAQLRAPVAVALAVLVLWCVRGLGRAAFAAIGHPPVRWRPTWEALIRATPYVSALTLLACQPRSHDPMLRLRDIESTAQVLRSELGWSFGEALRHLQAPDNRDVLAAWKLMYPEWVRAPAAPGPCDEERSAVLLKVAVQDLPNDLPSNWRIVAASNAEAAVLALLPSQIDWSHYTVCVFGNQEGPEHCVDTGLFDRSEDYAIALDAMPEAGSIDRGDILQIRFPLRPSPPGVVNEVFMPRCPSEMCSGRIVAVPEGSRIDDDGRRATLVSVADRAEASVLVVEWQLRDCRSGYSGFPPFFLEGDADAVRPLMKLMQTSWER